MDSNEILLQILELLKINEIEFNNKIIQGIFIESLTFNHQEVPHL